MLVGGGQRNSKFPSTNVTAAKATHPLQKIQQATQWWLQYSVHFVFLNSNNDIQPFHATDFTSSDHGALPAPLPHCKKFSIPQSR
jgi:hypothetical protein